MIDGALLSEIGRLTDQRQLLRQSHAGAPLSREKTEQLRAMETALDDRWGELRRRRARRRAGLGPDGASELPVAELRERLRPGTR